MKAIALLAAVALLSCSSGVDPSAAQRFEQAGRRMQEARTPEDFLQTAALYQSLAAEGIESGALFYDLGNAYLQAGRRGHAIAAYRQAQRYRPADPYLEANLANALGSLPAPPAPAFRWLRTVLFWQDWVAYPTKYFLVSGAASLTFLLGVLGLLLPRARTLLHRAAAVGLLATLCLLVSLGVDAYEYEARSHGVVVNPEVVARKGNAETFEPAFTEPLAEGTECLVLEERGRWVRVRVGRDLDGWIPADDLVVY